MPKYMMKNGLKKHPFDGFRYKVLKNGMKIRENVSFIFEPNKIIDTGDFDLSNWVEARYLIEVKEEEVKEEKSIDNSDEILENISIFSSDNVEFEKSEEDTEEEDTEEEDSEEEDSEDEDEIEEKKYNNDINDDNLKYDKIDDGFRCIICGKILKSEKRMNTHIKKKH